MGHNLKGDLFGGITSAVVALPLALAFGYASGAGAAAGLYSAIFTGLLASLFGGAPAQITGPTGAMTVVLVDVYAKYGLEGMMVATVLAGLMQIGFAAFKLGDYIHYIPHPVIAGFTNGIAILIFSMQIATFQTAPAVAVATMAIMFLLPRLTTAVPGSLVALIVTSVAVAVLGLPIKLIENIPQGLPHLHVPAFEWTQLPGLLQPALVLALLGAIESLLSAVVVDEFVGTKHKSNRELFGQGIANVVAPLFGGIAGTGAIVRSVVNVRAGGRTQLSGVVHSLLILAVTVSLSGLAARVPLATLAGLLMMTAIGMIDYQSIRELRRAPRSDAAVMLVTAFLTVKFDLTIAVAGGMLLSALLFTLRMTQAHIYKKLLHARVQDPSGAAGAPAVAVVGAVGPLFFGSTGRFSAACEQALGEAPALIIDMTQVSMVDHTGATVLRKLAKTACDQGKTLVLAGLHEWPYRVLSRLAVLEGLPVDHLAPDFASAIDLVSQRLGAVIDAGPTVYNPYWMNGVVPAAGAPWAERKSLLQ